MTQKRKSIVESLPPQFTAENTDEQQNVMQAAHLTDNPEETPLEEVELSFMYGKYGEGKREDDWLDHVMRRIFRDIAGKVRHFGKLDA